MGTQHTHRAASYPNHDMGNMLTERRHAEPAIVCHKLMKRDDTVDLWHKAKVTGVIYGVVAGWPWLLGDMVVHASPTPKLHTLT